MQVMVGASKYRLYEIRKRHSGKPICVYLDVVIQSSENGIWILYNIIK